ncbi:TonB family protein [Paraburkholderia phosphatilytica]|uniref:TonB family protein n=1 Tax=Paraburkholderia phosphatilytica TaxID=2282883 RepID=UPI000E50288D|nr:TonB family protein [Paraburkholderia phosphatilytica]
MATLSTARFSPDQRRLYTAVGVALFVELAMLTGAWVVLHRPHVETPPERPPTLLSLATAPAPKPAPVAPPVPQPVHPAPQPPRPHEVVKPLHHVTHAVPPRPMPVPVAPAAPVQPAAAPQIAAPQPAPVAPPPAPAGPSPSFESALRAAIEAALHYPESARMAGIAGRTRVAFHYRDGVVSDVTVVISSGVALLDRAALAAVRDADCPKPEPALVGKTLSEQLWVNFNLDNHE